MALVGRPSTKKKVPHSAQRMRAHAVLRQKLAALRAQRVSVCDVMQMAGKPERIVRIDDWVGRTFPIILIALFTQYFGTDAVVPCARRNILLFMRADEHVHERPCGAP
jgi:hypothetical protein